jgi:cell wall-associated NlpC family hydrolase
MRFSLLPLLARRCALLGALLFGLVLSAADANASRPPKKARVTATARARASAAPKPRRSARQTLSSRNTRRRSVAISRSARRGRISARERRRRAAELARGPIVPVVEQASFVSDSADKLRDSIVSVARAQIGTPYIWGADEAGRAFDCSGLVRYVMSWLNVRLPRTANEQAYAGIRIGRELDRMKPGDLLTFGKGRRITHIAIYSGNGRYVHASRPGVGVVESLLNPRAARFKGAVRLVADADTTTSKTAPTP